MICQNMCWNGQGTTVVCFVLSGGGEGGTQRRHSKRSITRVKELFIYITTLVQTFQFCFLL